MNEIKKINVDGVDYDIVSESAEKKIAELEKNNTALASVTFGTRNDFGDPVKVGLGTLPEYSEAEDIMIGKGTMIGEGVLIGSQYPVSMGWDNDGSFFIKSDGGNRGAISIGSNVRLEVGSGSGNAGIKGDVQIDSNSQLRISSAAINIYDTNLICNAEGLHFGTQGGHIGNNISLSMYGDGVELRNDRGSICQLYAEGCEISIGSVTLDKGLIVTERGSQLIEIGNTVYIGNSLTIGSAVSIGDSVHIGANVYIGDNLSSQERLHIQGPVYIKAETGVRGLTIGTDDIGIIKISWSEADKIVFTDVATGKKATLTLS